MSQFITKDSGARQQFDTGAKRDTQEGKPRYDLIPPKPLRRLAELYARGAEKYNEWNWSKGMPYSRFIASAMRHLFQYIFGEKDEDHLAAVLFNIMAIMHFDDMGMDYLNDLDSRYASPASPLPAPAAARPCPPRFWAWVQNLVRALVAWSRYI